MDDCCGTKVAEISALRAEHKNVLIVVLLINAALFVVEAVAGLLVHSTALLADSLDMARIPGLRVQSLCPLAQRGMEGEGGAVEGRNYGNLQRSARPTYLQEGL